MNKYEKALLDADDIQISEYIDCYDVFCYIERLKGKKKQAVKDFAEKLKGKCWQGYGVGVYIITKEQIDEALQEYLKGE